MERGTAMSVATLLAIVALVGLGVALGRDTAPHPAVEATTYAVYAETSEDVWTTAMARLDLAVEREDHASAVRAWQSAYSVAVTTRRWEPMLATGEAALRVAALDRVKTPYTAKARQAYLAALHHAYRDRSPEGLRRIAAAFTELGDYDAATRVLALAERVSPAVVSGP